MLHSLKRRFYFVVSGYFTFWAGFVLRRWQPRIVVITGSSGKTTLLHMVESQLKDQAVYSHHANSAFGISFQLLGLEPNVASKYSWLKYIVVAPFRIMRQPPAQKLYIVEADCDRPHEGEFTGKFLRPEVTLWASLSRTHSMNFDDLVKAGAFADHDHAIAHEFANFARFTSKLVIANGDNSLIKEELKTLPTDIKVQIVSAAEASNYSLSESSTNFTLEGQAITVPGLHPMEAAASLQMVIGLLKYLNLPFDPSFATFHMPPGRNNLLAGQNGLVLIDSTYNTGLGATKAVLNLFKSYPAPTKWLIIGDILEQGSLEQSEHEKLAQLLIQFKPQQIVLLGARNKSYSLPLIQKQAPDQPVATLATAGEVLDYLKLHLKGKEAILFKGAQGLEGVIEQLLANPTDADQLVRRSPVWVKRRQAWGLPR